MANKVNVVNAEANQFTGVFQEICKTCVYLCQLFTSSIAPSVMKFWKQISVLSGVILMSACQPPAAENRFAQLSKGCCECTAKLLELNQQAAQSPEKADFKALEAEYQHTKECIATVTNNLGKLKTEELPELEKQLQTTCPTLASQRELLQELLVK